MKGLKSKLMAATAMLTVSAVMLVSTSFAWYTLSTNPEIKGITAKAVVNENLEIALDKNEYTTGDDVDKASVAAERTGTQGSKTGNVYTWGNLVDLSGVAGVKTAMESYKLRPAALITDESGNSLKTASYGTDGRVDKIDQLLTDEKTYANGADGVAKVSLGTEQYAFKVVYWLRTNVKGAISLSTAEKRDTTNDSDSGAGSYIDLGTAYDNKDTIHVAFKVTPDKGATTWVTDKSITYADKDRDNHVAISGTIIDEATPNTAYKVEMYVFLNGDAVNNSTAASENAISVNVQFDNEKITNGAMHK